MYMRPGHRLQAPVHSPSVSPAFLQGKSEQIKLWPSKDLPSYLSWGFASDSRVWEQSLSLPGTLPNAKELDFHGFLYGNRPLGTWVSLAQLFCPHPFLSAQLGMLHAASYLGSACLQFAVQRWGKVGDLGCSGDVLSSQLSTCSQSMVLACI